MENGTMDTSEPGRAADDTAERPAIPATPPPPPAPRSETNDPIDGQKKSEETEGEDLLTKALRFLSTATPEVLGAIAVGLAAVTYFVLGQLGLLLIGAFGGVVLFISWEARNPEVSRAVRGEKGTEVLARLAEYKKSIALVGGDAEAGDGDSGAEERFLARSFDDFPPETREALNDLVDAVIRDYVKWWYSPIVPADKSFPLSCRKVLTSFLVSISNHLSRKRPADAFLDFVTNSSSIVIVFFSELSAAFAEMPAESGSVSAADAVYNYLAANPDSNLANLLSQRQQTGKFKMVAEDLLGFLDRPTYDCDPARVFLREMMAGVVLEMTLQMCSKPEWINGWIVYLLEAGEPDFNQAIDVGMQTRSESNNNGGNAFVDIDGNLGNIGLTKGNRNSFDLEKARRKESNAGHKKQLSRAEEEMEEAMEEMKRMNEMIAKEDARRVKESQSAAEAEERLAGAMKRNADELEMQPAIREREANGAANGVGHGFPSPGSSDHASPKAPSSSSDEQPPRNVQSPITPRSSTAESAPESRATSPRHELGAGARFTSFDQLVPPARDDFEGSDTEQRKQPPPLTLHNATITIHDEPVGDKGKIKSKPTWDYLIQIEPATSHYPGWMIVRKYSDFERLHEVLRRIATVSGITAFAEQHNALPAWKVHTRTSLRGELERYVRDACWHQPLAESEGMKRFLEKDSGHAPSSSKSGFQAFESMGKNVLDVLTNAPKGVAEGSKVVVGGVTGVLGNIGLGPRRATTTAVPTTSSSAVPASSALQDVTSYTNRLSISTPPRRESGLSINTSSAGWKSRDSLDSQRSSVVSAQPARIIPMDRRPSHNSQGEVDAPVAGAAAAGAAASRPDRWEYTPISARESSRHNSRASSMGPARSPSVASLNGVKLPPPPNEIADDYISPTNGEPRPFKMHEGGRANSTLSQRNSVHGGDTPLSAAPITSIPLNGTSNKKAKQHQQLTEQETRVAVELVFAVINELYTLSSAWNIRRTLLAAAKSFLLRPGNPSLASIQALLQSSVLDAHTTDAGVAAHLRHLRESALPTDAERAAWPPELSAEEKEKLRVRARRLLLQSGVPAALTGVMGQSATADALGRVFDCLQIEEVARGLVFGVMLQAMRVVTH